jgi:lysozyme
MKQLLLLVCILISSIYFYFNGSASWSGEYAIRGIDVSHYQSAIDWEKVANQQLDFVFVKATEGITLNDSSFNNNWKAIKSEGLRRGAYHFYRANVSPEQQALNFIRNVKMEAGDLPPVLDVETLDGAGKIELLAGMVTWLYMVEIAYGVKPVIYSNQKFYNTYLSGQFEDYPLWIARYHNALQPNLADGRKWKFWQRRDTGKLDGIEGDVDMNVFQGTQKELESMCMPGALDSRP